VEAMVETLRTGGVVRVHEYMTWGSLRVEYRTVTILGSLVLYGTLVTGIFFLAVVTGTLSFIVVTGILLGVTFSVFTWSFLSVVIWLVVTIVVIEEVLGKVVTTWVDRMVGRVVVVLKIVDNSNVVVVIYIVEVVTVVLT
jgi:hypothetical protein